MIFDVGKHVVKDRRVKYQCYFRWLQTDFRLAATGLACTVLLNHFTKTRKIKLKIQTGHCSYCFVCHYLFFGFLVWLNFSGQTPQGPVSQIQPPVDDYCQEGTFLAHFSELQLKFCKLILLKTTPESFSVMCIINTRCFFLCLLWLLSLWQNANKTWLIEK